MSLVLNVEILGEFKKLTEATKGSEKSLGGLETQAKKFSKGINTALAAVGIGLSVGAIINFGKAAIAGAEAAQVADKRLLQVTKSMDLFGKDTAIVTDRLVKFADKQELLTGVTAETVKQVQATLITFGELGSSADTVGGAFDRATQAALDLAAAGFGSAETNAIQLGKALQDPIKGLTALARSGVTFTEQEKERIKTLVESNQLGEAQALILAAIEQQVGGTAEATVTASARMEAAFGQITDAVGLALLPVLEEFSIWLSTPEGQEKLQEIIAGITGMIEEFQSFVGFLGEEVMPALEMLTGESGIEAVIIAVTNLVVAAGILKTTLAFMTAGNPFVAGVVAGIALIVTAYNLLGSSIQEVIDKQNAFKSGLPGGNNASGTVPLGTGSPISGAGGKIGIIGEVAPPTVPTTKPAVPAKPGTINININRAQVNANDVINAINSGLKNQGSSLRIQ